MNQESKVINVHLEKRENKDYLVFGDFATTWTSDVEMSLPTVSWKDGMKPTKESQYDTMEAAIGSASVTFTFTAAIKD